MTLKRTSRNHQKEWLKKNRNLKILDLGCSSKNYWPEANHYADLDDFSEEFNKLNLKYTQIKKDHKLPFKDKEFDYVILSHVLEHVPNLIEFISEIERISKAGYIELPTKLNDNLVFGCDEDDIGHKWWFEYDDIKNTLVYSKKIDALEKFVTVGQIWKFEKFFADSLFIQTYWEDKINISKGEIIKF